MDELITINPANEQFPINAKELYEKLELHPTHWARWAKQNIEENPFAIQGRDYQLLAIMASGEVSRVRGNFADNYELSIDFAKKLCMAAKTEKGEQYRCYFIELEKRFKQLATQVAIGAVDPQMIQTMVQCIEQSNETMQQTQKALARIGRSVFNVRDYVERYIDRNNRAYAALESTIIQQVTANLRKRIDHSKIDYFDIFIRLEVIKRHYFFHHSPNDIEAFLTSQGISSNSGFLIRYLSHHVLRAEIQSPDNMEVIEQNGLTIRRISFKNGQISVENL